MIYVLSLIPVCHKKNDLVFLIEDSDSNHKSLEKVLSFVAGSIKKLGGDTKVGIVTYSNEIEKTIYFNDYKDTASGELYRRILDMKITGGGSNLGMYFFPHAISMR